MVPYNRRTKSELIAELETKKDEIKLLERTMTAGDRAELKELKEAREEVSRRRKEALAEYDKRTSVEIQLRSANDQLTHSRAELATVNTDAETLRRTSALWYHKRLIMRNAMAAFFAFAYGVAAIFMSWETMLRVAVGFVPFFVLLYWLHTKRMDA